MEGCFTFKWGGGGGCFSDGGTSFLSGGARTLVLMGRGFRKKL